MDSLTYLQFKKMNDDLQDVYTDLYESMETHLRNKIHHQKEVLQAIYDNMTALHDHGSHMLNYQLFNVQRNFIRPKEAIEERTMGYLAMGFQEFALQVTATDFLLYRYFMLMIFKCHSLIFFKFI